jgi:ribosomal protein S27AE
MSEFEQKVLKLLGDINGKLDNLLKGGSGTTTTATVAASAPVSTPAVAPEPSRPKPSELVERQKEEERMIEKPPVEGRRVCPQCGATSFNTIEDKSQVLHQMGGVKIYAKKYICKSCGAEA